MTSRELILRDCAIRSIGCVCCLQSGYGYAPCEKHHLNEGDQPGRKRRGEAFTVGLCQWHHVGRCWCNGLPVTKRCEVCLKHRGPSWHHHKRAFLQEYGDGDKLLAYQNEKIAVWRGSIVGWAA